MRFAETLPNPIEEIQKWALRLTRDAHNRVDEFLETAPSPWILRRLLAIIVGILGGFLFLVPIFEILALYAMIYYILKAIDKGLDVAGV